MITNFSKLSLCAVVVSLLPLPASAVQYSLKATNVSDGASDQVVVDNTGAVISGGATASLGYFKTIADPGAVSASTLAGDFQALATSDFSENGGTVNGLFDIITSISNAESNTDVTDGNGKILFLFIGNATTLGTSGYIGLVNVGVAVPDVTVPASSYDTTLDYSAGKFADGGSILLGNITADSVSWGPGNSTGTFELVAVPEPSSTVLLGLGGVAFFLRRRR